MYILILIIKVPGSCYIHLITVNSFWTVNSAAVTGVCYVRPIKTIWVAGGTAEAAMYDPKSGENVSS